MKYRVLEKTYGAQKTRYYAQCRVLFIWITVSDHYYLSLNSALECIETHKRDRSNFFAKSVRKIPVDANGNTKEA